MTSTLARPELPAEDRPPETARRVGVERRVRLRGITRDEVYTLFGSALGALCLTWLVYERVLPTSGALGFWLSVYGAFFGLYYAAAYLQWGSRVTNDKVVTVAVSSAALFLISVLGVLIGYLIFRGWDAISHLNFFTQTMGEAGPLSPLTVGGAIHGMVGSLEQLALATMFAVPLGVLAAIFMAEVGGKFARPVRILVDAMTALPSIVAGLFVLSLWIVTFHFGNSGLAASFALTIMMMPIVTRASEVVIRLVPNTLREAAYALGSSSWRVGLSVVLPTARSGLTTAVLLAMARGIGETSPVLLTAGFTKEMDANPFSGQQANLPVYIWNYVRYPQATYVARAFGAGLTLMIVVLILFVVARLLGGRPPGELTRRQRRKIARANAVPVTSTAPPGSHPNTISGAAAASVARTAEDPV